jgi:coenzyme F420-dependent glucose-6-phosphate dehydrogenase
VVEIGYTLSSEEFRPNDLVQLAQRAEEAGFGFAGISDHYHPWLDSQGQAPFVWATLGGIAQVTQRLQLVTGVTCPTVRTHPAVIAQAAATVADMLPDRFIFGVGTGENLNEHITGARWPPVSVRREMLDEAVAVIRLLWQGGYQTHHGPHYTVENARIYTLPEQLPPIYVGASGSEAAELAGRIGDGLICTAPDTEVVETFTQTGGQGKPMYGQMTVCWGEDEEAAKQTAYEVWGYTALPGQLSQELALPMYFEQGMQIVTPDMVAESIVCGPDPARYHEQIKAYLDAGFTHVYLHQVGYDQEGFFRFAEREILPAYR